MLSDSPVTVSVTYHDVQTVQKSRIRKLLEIKYLYSLPDYDTHWQIKVSREIVYVKKQDIVVVKNDMCLLCFWDMSIMNCTCKR